MKKHYFQKQTSVAGMNSDNRNLITIFVIKNKVIRFLTGWRNSGLLRLFCEKNKVKNEVMSMEINSKYAVRHGILVENMRHDILSSRRDGIYRKYAKISKL